MASPSTSPMVTAHFFLYFFPVFVYVRCFFPVFLLFLPFPPSLPPLFSQALWFGPLVLVPVAQSRLLDKIEKAPSFLPSSFPSLPAFQLPPLSPPPPLFGDENFFFHLSFLIQISETALAGQLGEGWRGGKKKKKPIFWGNPIAILSLKREKRRRTGTGMSIQGSHWQSASQM